MLRQYCQAHFKTIFNTDTAAKNCEISVYNWTCKRVKASGKEPSWENKWFKSLYKHRFLAIDYALKKSEVLVPNLLSGALKFKEFMMMGPGQLLPDGPYETTRKKVEARKDEAFRRSKLDEVPDGMFQCKKCRSKKTTYYQLQTRSADEPMTTFASCLSCNTQWRF
jgi:hypothetical protein